MEPKITISPQGNPLIKGTSTTVLPAISETEKLDEIPVTLTYRLLHKL
ncbi:MAG: hypothetical protein ACI8Y7_001040 [Candidatus Woesearchaeota archaeon]|jgi:hypothetical protein